MPLAIVRDDITKMRVDATVKAARAFLPGGCRPGRAKIAEGQKLPCRYVIHTAWPGGRGGGHGQRDRLAACYTAALELAKAHGCETVAFPLIPSGIFKYPRDQALRVAADAIGEFLLHNEMTVYIAVSDKSAFQINPKRLSDLWRYIADHDPDHYAAGYAARYVGQAGHADRSEGFAGASGPAKSARMPLRPPAAAFGNIRSEELSPPVPRPFRQGPENAPAPQAAKRSLEEALREMDESFSEMLLRKIGERGMTDAQCYKKANIDRKLFSKIRGDIHYKPSKPTALAFAIALELPLEEVKDMLGKAGFALSHSSRFDLIIEYFIREGIYNIFEINEALFAFDQSLLGAYA